ncbi:hypothetical protein [Brevibacillus dissolubilis]|uniref:hypothetical protein n=1 Tax=Brevibacillus dissolubilis TaxID=1844116 RepID=UPI001116DAF5|nr:hypothetical protein [Brevibacillus dissolubilis]
MQLTLRRWSPAISLALIVSLFVSSFMITSTAQAAEDLNQQVYTSMKKAVKYYYKSNRSYEFKSFDWELIGLPAAGEKLTSTKWLDKSKKSVLDYWATAIKDEKNQQPGNLAKLAIGLMKNGYDPANFNGMNLFELIAKQQEENGRMGDDTYTIFNQGLSIIAFEMYGYQDYDRAQAVEFILKRYKEFQSIDEEAFMLNVLPFIGDVDGVDEAKAEILAKLADAQNENGSYTSWDVESPDTTLEVLIGLVSAEEDVYEAPWSNSVKFVLSHQVADGGFKSPYSNGESSAFTTEKALIALTSLKQASPLYEILTDKEKAALKKYLPTVKNDGTLQVFDGIDNLLKNKGVTASNNVFTVSSEQVYVRLNVKNIPATEEKPLAVLVKAMKGKEVAAVAIVEGKGALDQVTAGLTLDNGDYTVEVNFWYGLGEKPEVAKEPIQFALTVK